MGDTVNDLLDNLTDAMLAREDSCHGLARPHERGRAVTQWHNAVSAIHEALTREPLPTGTAGVVGLDSVLVAIVCDVRGGMSNTAVLDKYRAALAAATGMGEQSDA